MVMLFYYFAESTSEARAHPYNESGEEIVECDRIEICSNAIYEYKSLFRMGTPVSQACTYISLNEIPSNRNERKCRIMKLLSHLECDMLQFDSSNIYVCIVYGTKTKMSKRTNERANDGTNKESERVDV